MKHQKFFPALLQGALIGLGAVLPGISGGVLSVIFGIYLSLIHISPPFPALPLPPGRRILLNILLIK